jgi:hypothetical protein
MGIDGIERESVISENVRSVPWRKSDYFGSIPLEQGKVRHQGSRTARGFKNRTLKTEGYGTQNRLGAYVCATRPSQLLAAVDAVISGKQFFSNL